MEILLFTWLQGKENQWFLITLWSKNPSDENGYTPLHEAAQGGHIDICKLILDKITVKNPSDENGYTPLHETAQGGHIDVCKLILDKITNKSPINEDGKTPLDLAPVNNFIKFFELLSIKDWIE